MAKYQLENLRMELIKKLMHYHLNGVKSEPIIYKLKGKNEKN